MACHGVATTDESLVQVQLPERCVELAVVLRAKPRPHISLRLVRKVLEPILDQFSHGSPVGSVHAVQELGVALGVRRWRCI